MMITLMSDDEFRQTFSGGMIDITAEAEATINIWPYVMQLEKQGLVLNYVYQNRLVEKVYRNGKNTFDQILLPTSNKNIFIVIVVDVINKIVKGHYPLNLEKEYGVRSI